MFGHRRILITAALAGGLVTTGLTPAQQASAQPGTEVKLIDGIEMGFTATIDPKAKTMTVTDVSGRAFTRDDQFRETSSRTFAVQYRRVPPKPVRPAADSPTGENYQCVVSGSAEPGFKAYDVYYLVSPAEEKRADLQYRFFTYSLDRARLVGGRDTFQIERCHLGGGRTFQGWKNVHTGAASTMNDEGPATIGSKWATTARDGRVAATLGFSAGKEPVQVTGTLNVQPRGGYQGSTGRERRAKYLDDRFTVNQVNSWWEAAISHTIYDGTNDYTGNVGHALWEYPQADPTPHQTAADAWMEMICGRPFRRC